MQEPIFENIRFNLRDRGFSDKLRLESKTDIATDQVDKILDATAFVSLTEKEVMDGKIKYGGNVIYQICYQATDGSLKKYECGSEYLGVLSDERIKGDCSACLATKVEKTEVDLSGLKAGVTATVTVTATLYDCEDIRAVSGGEGLVIDKKEIAVVKSYGVKSGSYPVEEEFVIDFPVQEVLSHAVKAVVTNVQCGVGCIIADGEVVFNALLIGQDSGEIRKETKSVPFRMEIEHDEAMPVMQATARVREKTFKSDIAVDGETNKSTVTLTVNLAFDGEVFSEEGVILATDAFNLTEDVAVDCQTFSAYKPCEMRSYLRQVNGRATVNELPAEVRLVATFSEKAEIASVTVKENCVVIDGALSAVGFFKDGEGKSFTMRLETPFTTELDGAFNGELEVLATVKEGAGKMVSLSEIELFAEICFTAYPTESQSIQYIREIKSVGEKKCDTSAISVYIPFEGEELWSLAKRLNACPDELVSTNKDLQFPLTGKERIVIYRQKC